MRRVVFLVVVTFLLPLLTEAEGPITRQDGPASTSAITRRDGFLILWRSILRPIEETHEQPFEDVQEGDRGFLEITYAKARGILEDEPLFRPDEPLPLEDALLWLFRTRNVAQLDAMERKDLAVLLERYHLGDVVERTTGEEELTSLMRTLDAFLKEEVHEVSLYAEEFHGDHTACAEVFDMHALTAAHRTLPCGTLVRVTNTENGKSTVVRINDRGPYVAGRDMDLSLAAFTALAPRSQGKFLATFERLGDATVVQGCAEHVERRYQTRITRDVRFVRGVPHLLTIGETLVLRANRPFIVQSMTYPDGNRVRIDIPVRRGETYSFTPALTGTYTFAFRARGRVRPMTMEVVTCLAS
jgi:hypothetical protein